MTTDTLFQAAMAAHRSGRFADAEAAYRQVLVRDGRHADAFHMLGILQHQKGNSGEARALIQKALAIREDVHFLCNLGRLLQEIRHFPEAEAAYQRALALHPGAADAAYNLGGLLKESGRLLEAKAAYRNALSARPDFVDAYFNLANLLKNDPAGSAGAEAEACYRSALAVQPDFANALYNLGNLLKKSGRPFDAERTYRRVLAVAPQLVAARVNLGVLMQEARLFAEAEACYRAVLAVHDDLAEAHSLLGTVLRECGRLGEAEASLRRALQLAPDFAEAHSHLAMVLLDLGRADEAMNGCRLALALAPAHAEAYHFLGLAQKERGAGAAALINWQRAVQIDPGFAAALYDLGNACYDQGRFDEAEACIARALKIEPYFAPAHAGMAAIVGERGDYGRAEDSCRHALVLQPDSADAQNNLAIVLQHAGQIEAAQACFRRAMEIAPANVNIRFNHALVLLLIGDWQRGWREYECRWGVDGCNPLQQFEQPLWLGDADLQGKTILLHHEQGFGDSLQFVRYASLLAARGARVNLAAPPELKRLLASCTGVQAVFSAGEPLPPFDYHCPMMSLPLACGTGMADIPASVPYLSADAAAIAQWREKLGKKAGLRIGLAWAGNPRKHLPLVHALDRLRSMHFDQLRPLLDVDGVEFFSLQLGKEAVLQLHGETRVIDITGEISDFYDTAALMESLDLIICVDTSVAHLAGATGRPFWLLNRYNTCWRWFAGRADSPWYPTARIFRQPTPGDWDSVIASVKTALEQRVIGTEVMKQNLFGQDKNA